MEWRNYSWYPSSCPRAPVQNTESNFGLPHTGKASTSRSECIRGAVRWSWAPVVRREPGSQPCLASESPASTNQEGSSLWYLMGAGIKWNKKPSDCLEEKLCPLENTTVYSRDGKALEQDGQSPHLKVSNTGVEEEIRSDLNTDHGLCRRLHRAPKASLNPSCPTIIRLGTILTSITKDKQNPKQASKFHLIDFTMRKM